jgi:NADH-quinone oxidoreductase subunit M
MSDPILLLSAIVFLPVVGAVLLAFIPGNQHETLRLVTLAVTIAVLLCCIGGLFTGTDTKFDAAAANMQNVFTVDWIPSFNIYYYMGVDGISFPLLILTAAVSVLAMGASWSITKQVKGYCILFLLLETGMLGVFLALDFFLFYVFWEVMLLPMYFLIGVWGGPRKEYAAIKFFLYTLVGSVLMLIAILLLYFNSDLRKLAAVSDIYQGEENGQVDWDRLNIAPRVDARLGRVITAQDPQRNDASLTLIRTGAAGDRELAVQFQHREDAEASNAIYDESANEVTVYLAADDVSAAAVAAALQTNPLTHAIVRAFPVGTGRGTVLPIDSVESMPRVDEPVHTFNILALAAIGQHTECFDKEMLFGWSIQRWCFLLLFIGFAVKVPSVPLHTWLPDAHVEAPTPISMILAGILLKMGGYGIIRICYPICPAGGYDLTFFVCLVGVVSMVYGAFAALAQKDFKRMVAYSSVSHMGYVVLGLGVWSARDGMYVSDYWNMGVQGAMFQMIAHGVSSAGMFFMVGVLYDRVHHRDLDQFGGVFGKMPVYSALAIGIFFAGLGLPGLCGFVGEVFVVLSVYNYSVTLAVISAAVVILTAGYILWAVQRVYLGAEYKGPHPEALIPSTARENTIAGILFVTAILFGVLPYHTVLRFMENTVEQQVDDLTEFTRRYEPLQQTRRFGLASAEDGEDSRLVESSRPVLQDVTIQSPISAEMLLLTEPPDDQP